jgi:hypothetical protein
MRTKTLVLAAAIGAITVASAAAQTVYSVNAVGYVNKTVPANAFALLANPLNLATNSLAAVLPDVPANTKVYKFSGGTFTIITMRAAPTGWGTFASTTINPGEGFFIKNGSATDALNITFVGEVLQGQQDVAVGTGFQLLGSKIPQAGLIQSQLGFPAKNGDKIYLFRNGTYTIVTRRTDATPWPSNTEPTLDVGEGFFSLLATANTATTWSRTFNVNQ